MIKVESHAGDPFRGFGLTFQDWNRGKRSICIDLKTEAGRGVLYKLVEDADVVVENYRPGVSKRLGADYETLSKINPNLVYCSVSAYGQEGPYRSKPGFDPLLQARSGAMDLPGWGDETAGFPGHGHLGLRSGVSRGLRGGVGVAGQGSDWKGPEGGDVLAEGLHGDAVGEVCGGEERRERDTGGGLRGRRVQGTGFTRRPTAGYSLGSGRTRSGPGLAGRSGRTLLLSETETLQMRHWAKRLGKTFASASSGEWLSCMEGASRTLCADSAGHGPIRG